MTYVWVNKRDWKHPGPIVNIAVRNAHSLGSLGLETYLCLGQGDGSDVDQGLRDFYGVDPIETLKIQRSSRSGRPGGHTSSGPIFHEAVRLVSRLVKSNGGDKVTIITREGSFLPHLVWLRGRFGDRIKTFFEAHDFYADLAWKKSEGQRIKAQDRRQSWLERIFLPRVNGLICITRAQQELYRKKFPRLASCSVPLGVVLMPSTLDSEDRRLLRRAVYVGRLSRGKGRDLLIRAAPRLAAAGVSLAIWGGSAEQAATLTARAAEAGAPEVECIPSRSPEELQKALQNKASIGLAPLTDDFYNRYLTCPVKALDYLGHGLPVVASDLPSTREVIGNHGAGLFVEPNDHESITRAILDLLDNQDRYAQATEAARTRAREISWTARAEQIKDFTMRTK